MRIALATAPGTPDQPNLDWAAGTTCGTAVLLDGLTEATDTGCRHGTEWYVRELGTRLLASAADRRCPLPAALAAALAAVADAHRGSCDLGHPGSPGATVAVLRGCPGSDAAVEYLVLSDAVVLLDAGDGPTGPEPTVITDRRVDTFLPELAAAATGAGRDGPSAGRDGAALRRLIEAQQRLRNHPDGYWIARDDPGAAAHAVTGRATGIRAALLLSDGAAVLASHFGALSWRELADLAMTQGPAALIAATREMEARDPDRTVWPRYKVHDDATAVLGVLRPLPGGRDARRATRG